MNQNQFSILGKNASFILKGLALRGLLSGGKPEDEDNKKPEKTKSKKAGMAPPEPAPQVPLTRTVPGLPEASPKGRTEALINSLAKMLNMNHPMRRP